MTTLVLKNNSPEAQQFLRFARTLPYIDIIESDDKDTVNILKVSVAETLNKAEQGEDLIICENAEEMFKKLGI
jgi:hypothetical protein